MVCYTLNMKYWLAIMIGVAVGVYINKTTAKPEHISGMRNSAEWGCLQAVGKYSTNYDEGIAFCEERAKAFVKWIELGSTRN